MSFWDFWNQKKPQQILDMDNDPKNKKPKNKNPKILEGGIEVYVEKTRKYFLSSRSLNTRIVVVSGSGLSVASGLSTYRREDGLWNNHKIDEVCAYSSFSTHYDLAHEFYNDLRQKVTLVRPNLGHQILDGLPILHFTQNVDGLSQMAIPVHGELSKMNCLSCRTIFDVGMNFQYNKEMCWSCGAGRSLKPNVVFFGEKPPLYPLLMHTLQQLTSKDLLVVVGTSGEVLPIALWMKHHPDRPRMWLYNKEREFKLPEIMFEKIVLGDFEQTCFDLKDQIHQILHR